MSNQPEYFGGTPTQGYRKKRSVLEGILEDVKQSPIYEAGAAAAEFGGKALSFAMGAGSVSPQVGISTLKPTVEARAAGVPAEVVTRQAKEAQAAQTQKQVESNLGLGAGPVGVALGASEAAWSYGVARPISTGNLLADPNSPLYKDGFIEQGAPGAVERVRTQRGFQWDDLRQSWNRSEQVTATQAAVANPIMGAIPGLNIITSIGGINAYDPWSVYDMSKAQDNPYYKFITGSGDLALQVAVPTATKITRLAAMEKAGLRTTVKDVRDLDGLRDDWDFHKEHEGTGGVSGHKTTMGMWVDAITEETNPSKIRAQSIVANASGIDKAAMADILSKTNDKDTVANLLLATWGDQVAMKSLMEAAPDHVWRLSDMDSNIQNAWINGERFAPRGESLARVNQIFDSAVARDEYFTSVRDQFVRGASGEVDGGLLPVVGSTFMPTKRILVEKARIAKGKVSYAARTADVSDAPRWVQQVAQTGPGAPATIFLQWVGSRQPLGHVSKSGARPNDIWEELSATFDSVPQFRGQRDVVVDYMQQADGSVTPVTMPAPQYRQKMFDRLTEANSRGSLLEEWRLMEDEIVNDMARSLNVDPVKAAKYVQGYRQAADEAVNYIQESGGYLFDERGGRILLDAQTQRQLLNSFPTAPLRDIFDSMQFDESGIFRRGYETATGTGVEVFDAGLKFFRTNVLFRPGYTGKNSIIEPLFSSYLAHGTIMTDEGIGGVARNVGANISKRLKRVAYSTELDTLVNKFVKGQPVKTRRSMRNEMNELVNQRFQTQQVLDEAMAELDNLRSGRVSAATVERNTEAVRGALVDAQLRLERIDAALDERIPEWRQIVEPARLVDVRRALQEYNSLRESGQLTDELAGDVASLQVLYDDIIESSAVRYEDPARKVELAAAEMSVIDQRLAALGRNMGERREKIADASTYSGSGDGYMTLRVGGEEFQIPAAFSDRPYDFGSAFRAEASAAGTNRLTLDPSYRASYEVGRWQRTGDVRTIDPNDPIYWDELAHVVNRFFRGDALVQIYLETGSRERVAQFLLTPKGRKYQKDMNKEYLTPRERYTDSATTTPSVDKPMRGIKDIEGGIAGPAQVKRPKTRGARRVLIESTTELDELLRIVDQYLPSAEAKRIASTQEVTPGQLQRIMSNERLSRISGEDMAFVPRHPVSSAYNTLNRGLDKIWQFIATMPEDRIARWPFYQREFKMQMENRANILESQGVKMSNKQFAALRQSSHRDALAELEKTFYNIRRYNSLVYMSRFLMSFPGAFFNSIYRYGRFSVKEPERVFQSLLLSNDILSRGSVDEDGNPVEKVSDAAYFVIPGTKREPGDTGMRIPIGALTSFAVNYPGLSYASTVGISAITSRNPSTEQKMQDFFGPAIFDEMFPYGIPRDWESAFLGSYQKDLIRSFQGESNEQFIQSNVQIYADSIARWERDGMNGPAPTFADAIDDTEAFYTSRGGKKFFSAFSIQEQPPGQLMRDSWYNIRELYPDNTEEARRVYIEQYGEWARWYTYSSSDYTAYLPSTQDAYKRVWVDFPDLTRDITSLVGDDSLEYVSLLSLGTDGQFSPAVSNYYRETPLPGDDVPVVTRMNPESFNNMVLRSDGWNAYSKNRILFDTEMTRLRALRDNSATEHMKDKYRDEIDNLESGWSAWVDQLKEVNEPWAFDFDSPSGNKASQASKIFKKILANDKFKRGPGGEVLWQNVDVFINGRDEALEAIKQETDSDVKAEIRRGFVEWVNNQLIPQSPEFVSVWERYFSREWTEL